MFRKFINKKKDNVSSLTIKYNYSDFLSWSNN